MGNPITGNTDHSNYGGGFVDQYGHSLGTQEEPDGSIVDFYGNRIGVDTRLEVIATVENLPIAFYKEKILEMVGANRISIVQGETGSGKTTQVGKILHLQNPSLKVVTTVPRVLSAISVANRVSQELLCDTGNPYYSIGHGVGYRTGDYKHAGVDTPLAFHTDGTEQMRFVMSGLHPDILILDEIHNYAIPTEILAEIVKKLLKNTHEKMKVILMSATLDPKILQDYFASLSNNIPVLKVPGRTFPITSYYNNGENPTETVVTNAQKGNHILLFCHGKSQIQEYTSSIREKLGSLGSNNYKYEVMPLHAELPREEQMKIMSIPPKGTVRIIASTNVAEESITLPYLHTVVDLSTEKALQYDRHGVPSLVERAISQANIKQRMGRCGRIKDGEYMRENPIPYDDLREYPLAPIETQMLDRNILLKAFTGENLREMYQQSKQEGNETLFIHPINEPLLHLSYKRLEQIDALDQDGKITELGKEILKYPMSVHNARILIESFSRGCSQKVLIMTAILEQNGFVSHEGKWQEIKCEEKKEGDIFALYSLYNKLSVSVSEVTDNFIYKLQALGCDIQELTTSKEENPNDNTPIFEKVDLTQIGINEKRLRQISTMINGLTQRLSNADYTLESGMSVDQIKNSLLAGSIHNIFRFSKGDQGKKKAFRAPNYPGYEFIAGKFSGITAELNKQYIATPFVIGGTGGQEDLPIVTHLVPIDASHIAEFSHQISGNNAMFPGESRTRPFKKIDIATWTDSMDDFMNMFQSSKFESPESAQEFFLFNIVPEILLESNNYIKNFLAQSPNKFDGVTFKELLKRVLKDEKSRINLHNLEQTLKSFQNDTTILDAFRESSDSIIQAFLAGKQIYPTQLSPHTRSSLPKLADNMAVPPHELIDAKKKFAALVGRAGQEVDLDSLYAQKINAFTQSQILYSQISHVVTDLSVSDEDIRLIKTISNISATNAKRKAMKSALQEEINKLEREESSVNNSDIYRDLQSKLKAVTSSERYQQSQINQHKNSLGIQIYLLLFDFVNQYFSADYTATLRQKLLQSAKTILQQQKNKTLDLNSIMRKFFTQESVPFLKDQKLIFTHLAELDTILYTLENFRTTIYKEIQDPHMIDLDLALGYVQSYDSCLDRFYHLKNTILSHEFL